MKLASRPVAAACLALALPCGATDLLTAYRQALTNDALYLSEEAGAEADAKELPKSVSGLLPSLAFSGAASRNYTDSDLPGANGVDTELKQYYYSQSYALTLRQPLYRKQNWAQFRQAQAAARRARAGSIEDKQALALRVATAYLEAVLAAAQVDVEKSREEALDQMLALTEKAFNSGASTLTDVYDVRAHRDLSAAAEIEASNALNIALNTLQSITNVEPGAVAPIDYAKLPLAAPPGKLDELSELAETANPNLEQLRQDLESARQEKQKSLSGYYPSLDLVLSHRRASNEVDTLLNRGTKTSLVGVQASIPLFSGGYTWFETEQTSLRVERARLRVEAGRHEISAQVRREFGDLVHSAAKVAALQQAVASSEQSLTGTQKGVVAGTRTTPDVLNAQDQLYRVKAELARAGGQYVLAYLHARDVAGALDDRAIQDVNGWLRQAP
jgi:outer membrane protein, protease secretion system